MTDQEILNKVIKVQKAKELTLLGFKSFAKNNFEDALSCADKVVELNPKNPLALQFSALCKCSILVNRDSINLSDKVYLREVILDLTNATNLTNEVQQISQIMASRLTH